MHTRMHTYMCTESRVHSCTRSSYTYTIYGSFRNLGVPYIWGPCGSYDLGYDIRGYKFSGTPIGPSKAAGPPPPPSRPVPGNTPKGLGLGVFCSLLPSKAKAPHCRVSPEGLRFRDSWAQGSENPNMWSLREQLNAASLLSQLHCEVGVQLYRC